jgi:16S rRNA (adenine1518-N6/adenine1519-N6)-dimethyltransferase
LIIQRIVAALNLQQEDKAIEIGPGLGALTMHIMPLVKHLQAVELDRDLIPQLIAHCQNSARLTVHQGDALRFDFTQLTQQEKSLRLIGNLPYNISTPLLFHFLEQAHVIKDMHFMLQKEVVERMAAQPGQAAYGRLSVMVQYYCQPEALFIIRPGAFNPPPKVDSAFIRLTPYITPPFKTHDVKLFTDIVRTAFNQRRKTLRNSLREVVNIEQLQALNIDPQQRPERLAVKDYVAIANALA